MFEIKSSQIRVTDPCYDKAVTSATILDQCLNGTWKYDVSYSDGVVQSLIIHHETVIIPDPTELYSTDIGVDSGQCGFYDEREYPTDSHEHEYEPDTFYMTVCNGTIADEVIELKHGVFSSSGYGDGRYSVYVQRNSDGLIISAELVYVTDIEDDYEDEFDWNEDEE